MFDSVPSDAVGYVSFAYLFFLLMVLVYIAILGAKFQRINRELGELIEELDSDGPGSEEASGATDPATADGPDEPAADSPLREESSV